MSSTFHHGNLATSDRLQNLLAFLKERGPVGATTWELRDYCDSTRPSSDVSELRHNGLAIHCQFERTTENGCRVNRYTLQPIDRPVISPTFVGAEAESAVILPHEQTQGTFL